MKERPSCELCSGPALVYMYDRYYCGACVMKLDQKNKEKMRKEMEDMLNDD